MKILAHRGYWRRVDEQNQDVAFRAALSLGFGIETDIRDLDGDLVVSHDPPRQGALKFSEFLRIYQEFNKHQTLALNIKSDSLAPTLSEMLRSHQILNYFCFDMSVPDSRGYFAEKLKVFTRRSEFEAPSLLDRSAQGAWLDSFEADHVSPKLIEETLQNSGQVAIVSPELHRKPHIQAWSEWKSLLTERSDLARDRISICTDFPEQARDFFGTK